MAASARSDSLLSFAILLLSIGLVYYFSNQSRTTSSMATDQKAQRPEPLANNWAILSADEQKAADLLLSLDQGHLFAKWPAAGTDDAKKKGLLQQTNLLNSQYPGGLAAYVSNAKTLLENAKKGVNPFEGYTAEVPIGERLNSTEESFHKYEATGIAAVKDAAFCMVAGGLGERLGYNGIKVALPSDLITEKTFLQLYCEYILAFQARARRDANDAKIVLPLAIMTSDDTHNRTVALLEANNNFGMAADQIRLIKQEKVPAITDNSGHFATEEDPYQISTKPHGHGDVHMLLHSSGLAQQWASEGRKWLVFFQDTNGLVFRAIPAALGVSASQSFIVNSLAVPRKPGEAVGGIMKLKHTNGSALTINVEYNQLDDLLRGTETKGDKPDATGFSPYPGNINVLIFNIPHYAKTLTASGGAVPEFVNPKYDNAEKTKFKKPTRLECMMQDYPRCLDTSAKVGFTQFERWLSFSAVKNAIAEAVGKAKQTGFAESAASGEHDLYMFNRKLLHNFGVKVDVEAKVTEFAGVPVPTGAMIHLAPSFGLTQADVMSQFGVDLSEAKQLTAARTKAHITISPRSTLVVSGDVTFKHLQLDGTLIIRAAPGAHVVVEHLVVNNNGYSLNQINPGDATVPEKYRIRGYVLNKPADSEIAVYEFAAGSHTINQQ